MEALKQDLALANRILYDHDVIDGFGHVSARDPRDPDRFLLARNMAPGLVTPADILTFDRDAAPIDAGGRRVYLERFMHAAVYRARPEVMAIVHSHSPPLIPFGVTGTPLLPVYHMSAFLGAGTPIFDIRDIAGDTNMLVSDNALGDALAKTLGDRTTVLLRGHGSLNVGVSIPQVVYRAIYTEISASLQSEASRIGPVRYLTPGEAERADASITSQLARPWELWKASIGPI
ncbi:MAG: class II aldolase/adducin family protein, partial [Acidimicrobiia bacterium]|nr:class II aldolase/adducin family protein [Acidimicrobiia bacterium]